MPLKKHEIRVGQVWKINRISLYNGNYGFLRIEHSVPKKRNNWFYTLSNFIDGPWVNEPSTSVKELHARRAAVINEQCHLVYDPVMIEKRALEAHKPDRRLQRVMTDD